MAIKYGWDDLGNRWAVDEDGNKWLAEEQGAGEAFLTSAGYQFDRFGRGIRSALGQDVREEAQERERLMRPVEQDSPIASFAGRAAPSLATAPLTAGSMLANVGLQAGLGAAEGALDYDPDSSAGQRALLGGAFGVGGDFAGRALGRVANMVKGGVLDAIMPRQRAVNQFADDFEKLGGQTLAYQRMAQGTRGQRLAERAMQGAEASPNPPTVLSDAFDANEQLFRDTAAEAVGLPGQYDNLGPEFMSDALANFNQGFRDLASRLEGAPDLQVSDRLKNVLQKQRSIKRLSDDFGDFAGLDDGLLSPAEYAVARRSLSQDASREFANGSAEVGHRINGLVDDLDGLIAERVPDDFLPAFARLREQYRIFSILEQPNVINQGTGQINVRTLNNKLRNKSQGFGRVATTGQEAGNVESSRLMNLMRAADRPEFKALRSSGTAENLALDNFLDASGEAVQGALGGDPRAALSLGGRLLSPGIIGMSQMGDGRMFQGAFTEAGRPFVGAGGAGGRSLLDEQFYPFVGSEDDRQR